MLKDIINTEARFLNRKRPKGWLTPSARHLIQTHLSAVSLIGKILPISGAAFEVNRFAFMELEAGHRLYGETFQNGPLKGYLDAKEAAADLQGGCCLLCGKKKIGHFHHIIPRSRGGSDTVRNIAGLCLDCHAAIHTDPEVMQHFLELHKGLVRRYSGTSLLNTVIPFLMEEFRSRFPDRFYPVTGRQTAGYRNTYGFEKDHDIDAYVIACSGLGIRGAGPETDTCFMRQYRNHDRAVIKSQTERTYYLGKTVVAKNRRPRFEQKGEALSSWYEKQVSLLGEKKAGHLLSVLTVKKSTRRYNRRDRLLPGTLFRYRGRTYLMSGQITGGAYLRAAGEGSRNFPYRECTVVRKGGGILFV